MGSKRTFSEAQDDAKSRDGPSYGSSVPKRFKAGDRHFGNRQKIDDSERKMNSVKKRARDIERILKRLGENGSHFPADKQLALERELAAHRQRISRHDEDKKRKKMISKYHGVRFFERKKALRLVKQFQQQLEQATGPDEIVKAKQNLHIAEVDVDYTRYFPLMERYESLYGGGKASEQATEEGDDEKLEAKAVPRAVAAFHAPRPPIWKTVEETREQGQRALDQLRDRQPAKSGSTGAESTQAVSKASSKSNASHTQNQRDRLLPKKADSRGYTVRTGEGQGKQQSQGTGDDWVALGDGKDGNESDGSGFFEED